MIRTFLTLSVFWIFMFFTLIFFIPYIPLLIPGLRKIKEAYVLRITRLWARFIISLTGSKVEVRGLENLPEERNVCFVSNHQSYFDIPVVMASIPRIIGFMAKKELKYIPFLNSWMGTIGCLFLDRKNPRQALKVFDKGAQEIRNGKAKLIFPEGTRSRGGKMGPVHAGALKLAFRSNAVVVPLTISGTYHLFEEKGEFAKGNVVLTIHKPMSVADLSREEQKEAAARIQHTIAGELPTETSDG